MIGLSIRIGLYFMEGISVNIKFLIIKINGFLNNM